MEILGIIREGYDISVNKYQKEIIKAKYVGAESDGFWYPYFTVGDNVKKGELLGIVKTMDGIVVQTLRAKFDAIILYYTLSLGVRKNDTLMAYGREI